MTILFTFCLLLSFMVLENYLIYCVEKKSPDNSAATVVVCSILWAMFYYFSIQH